MQSPTALTRFRAPAATHQSIVALAFIAAVRRTARNLLLRMWRALRLLRPGQQSAAGT
jgi:hypothetical protein